MVLGSLTALLTVEEGDCLTAVHQAVVVCQRDEHHGTDYHLNRNHSHFIHTRTISDPQTDPVQVF